MFVLVRMRSILEIVAPADLMSPWFFGFVLDIPWAVLVKVKGHSQFYARRSRGMQVFLSAEKGAATNSYKSCTTASLRGPLGGGVFDDLRHRDGAPHVQQPRVHLPAATAAAAAAAAAVARAVAVARGVRAKRQPVLERAAECQRRKGNLRVRRHFKKKYA